MPEPLELQTVMNQRVVRGTDRKWYIFAANGFQVRGPFPSRELAEVALKNRIRQVERELQEGDTAA